MPCIAFLSVSISFVLTSFSSTLKKAPIVSPLSSNSANSLARLSICASVSGFCGALISFIGLKALIRFAILIVALVKSGSLVPLISGATASEP